jgi:hypothetical protein
MGLLLLILPKEVDLAVRLYGDNNQHYYCWTFQTLANLLLSCDWEPVFGAELYGPFMLRTARHLLPPAIAVSVANKLGHIKKSFPSIMMLARGRKHV